EIGDEVGAVAGMLFALAAVDERRIMVNALAGEDVPVVEARGVGREMPLADHGSLVSGGLELFGDVVARGVETVLEGVDAIAVRVLAGEDGGAARSADGVGTETVGEADPALRDA